jgi:membrane protease YdiL (CAAX protease family)
MAVETAAFDRYRRSPNEKTTVPRLIAGTLLIIGVWLAVTVAVIFVGSYLQERFAFFSGPGTLTFRGGDSLEDFLASRMGFVAALLTFAGIWVGVWLAMKAVHRERLGRLLGNSGRISRSGFLNGFAAVLLTSVLTEICMYPMSPGIVRGSISLPSWLIFLLPVTVLGFVQTSAEELLFRGYFLRGLAYRFRSPIAWALLPALAFTVFHWNTAAPLAMNIGVFVSIAAFAAMLVLLVYATGNLGAAMGAHLGNNLTGFLLISHDSSLSAFALLRGAPLDRLTATPGQTFAIVAISIAAVLLSLLLLMHPRSPLKVEADLGRDESPQDANRR